VVFYRKIDKTEPNEDGEIESYRVLRYTPMFNTDQCDGLSVPNLSQGATYEHEHIAAAEKIVDAMPNRPTINRENKSGRAFYRPSVDQVTVPTLAQFPHAEEFYSVLFHELGHSTGHKSRLDREFGSFFDDHTYSKEELVAEFTATYLCAMAGIESRTMENSAAYISSWLTVLKDKQAKKWIPWAAGQAQKAANYIQGINIAEEKQAA
jgi:antirestriction protein ArdC